MNCTHSIQGDRNTRLIPSLAFAQQLIKMKTTLNVFVWRIQLLDRTVQSGQSTPV